MGGSGIASYDKQIPFSVQYVIRRVQCTQLGAILMCMHISLKTCFSKYVARVHGKFQKHITEVGLSEN